MESVSSRHEFHRLSSERRRKLWSLAAKAAVHCTDDNPTTATNTVTTAISSSSLDVHKHFLAKTQDSGLSVDIHADVPHPSAGSSFSSTVPRASLDLNPHEDFGYKYPHRFYSEQKPNSLVETEENPFPTCRRKERLLHSLGSEQAPPEQFHRRPLLKPGRRAEISRQREISAGSSGLGSSLDWHSVELPRQLTRPSERTTPEPLKGFPFRPDCSYSFDDRFGERRPQLETSPHDPHYDAKKQPQSVRIDTHPGPHRVDYPGERYENFSQFPKHNFVYYPAKCLPYRTTRSFEHPTHFVDVNPIGVRAVSNSSIPTDHLDIPFRRDLRTDRHFLTPYMMPSQHWRYPSTWKCDPTQYYTQGIVRDNQMRSHAPGRYPQNTLDNTNDPQRHRSCLHRGKLAMYPVPPPTDNYMGIPHNDDFSGMSMFRNPQDYSRRFYKDLKGKNYEDDMPRDWPTRTVPKRNGSHDVVLRSFDYHNIPSASLLSPSMETRLPHIHAGMKRPIDATYSSHSTPGSLTKVWSHGQYSADGSGPSHKPLVKLVKGNSTDRPLAYHKYGEDDEIFHCGGRDTKPNVESHPEDAKASVTPQSKRPLKSALKQRSTSHESDTSTEQRQHKLDKLPEQSLADEESDSRRIQFVEGGDFTELRALRPSSEAYSSARITDHSKTSGSMNALELERYAEYWDHVVFITARMCAVGVASLASLCLFSTVGSSTWVYYGTDENQTYGGFWRKCKLRNDTCVHTIPFFTNRMGWHDGALCMLLLAILLGILGTGLALTGHLVTSIQKRLYYFHSGGELHVVAGFVTALSLTIFHVTMMVHVRPVVGPIILGASYICSWFACIMHVIAAFLLFLDEIFHRLAVLSTNVKCIRIFLNCLIRLYGYFHKKHKMRKRKRLQKRSTEYTMTTVPRHVGGKF